MDLPEELSTVYTAHAAAVRQLRAFFDEVQLALVQSYSRSKNSAPSNELAHTPVAMLVTEEDFAADRLARQQLREYQEQHQRFMDQLSRLRTTFPDLLNEMSFIYRVALWDALLPDVLKCVLLSKPEILRSKQTLTHAEILGHADMAALTQTIANRELQKLGYQSVAGQRDWIQSHLGIDLFLNQAECNEFVELNARRNLFVHANGVVNEVYIDAVTNTPYHKGQRLDVPMPYWRHADQLLVDVAERLLTLIGSKFCPDAKLDAFAKRLFQTA